MFDIQRMIYLDLTKILVDEEQVDTVVPCPRQTRYLYFCMNHSICVVHLSMRIARNTMDTKGAQSNARDLWRHRWEGLSDPSVGEAYESWELLPTEIKSQEDKTMVIG